MEEVANLINIAKNVIEQLENNIFSTRQLKYIVVKSATTIMQERIEAFEDLITFPNVNYEMINNMKYELNNMIDSVEQIGNLFRENENSIIIIDGDGNFKAEPALFHVELEKKSYIDQTYQKPEVDDYMRYVDSRDVESMLTEEKYGIKL
ncbi:MAG: hypothetical protein J1F35_03990 [Erysipelotrichales bacterium]|nr:hypothetical protein [Erysipelotrichales bacterium]